MSGHAQADAADTVRDQAIAWLVRIQSDAASPRDWQELAEWLEASPDHLAAFEEVERLSAQIDAAAGWIGPELARPAAEVARLRPTPAPPRRSRFVFPALVAAAAAGIVAVSLLTWLQIPARAVAYRTGIGQTREVILADGSHVRLDAASQISVRMSATERRVEMGEAQASFDVAKDPGRPFVIRFGDEQIRVVGTEFNVRNYNGRGTVTVRRGVVQVSAAGRAGPPIRLTRGDELRHLDGSGLFDRRSVDPDDAFAWTQGRLVADDEPVTEVAAWLSRRYATPVRVEGRSADRFSGVLVLADEATTVGAFAQLTSRRLTRSPAEFVLRR